MEDRSGKSCVGCAFPENLEEMSREFGATGSDHRNTDGLADRSGQCEIEAGLSSVAVDGREQNFACADFDAAACPVECVPFRGLAAALGADLPVIGVPSGVDGENHGVVAAAELNGALYVLAKGPRRLLRLQLTEARKALAA